MRIKTSKMRYVHKRLLPIMVDSLVKSIKTTGIIIMFLICALFSLRIYYIFGINYTILIIGIILFVSSITYDYSKWKGD